MAAGLGRPQHGVELTADVAVVGLGAMGTAALWRLASRGADVVGFERFQPGHALGSSHGATRILRAAYSEGPQYVPLLLDALGLWRRLGLESGQALFQQTGALLIGPPDAEVVAGALRSAREHQLPHSTLDRAEMARRYPQHRLAAGELGVLDELGGVLFPETSITAAATIARARGAVIHEGARVDRIEPHASHVDIVVGSDRHRVRHAVICAGPWLQDLVSFMGVELAVERQVMTWFVAESPELFAPGRFPVFVRESAGGRICFGIPDMGDGLVKVGAHHGGEVVHPDSIDRSVDSRDFEMAETFVAAQIDGLVPSVARAVVCMYTNTPDEHFIIGPMPGAPNVTILSACSGHGFKFAPVIGEIAADLALLGGTKYEIGMFSPDRVLQSPSAG